MARGPMSEETKAKIKATREANKTKKVEDIKEEALPAPPKDNKVDKMNDLALRIFQGQSPDLPPRYRVERIVKGLKAQGYEDFSELDLPVENLSKYL